MDDRRTDRYVFTSMKALIRYFSAWLSEQAIEEVIEDSKVGFMQRTGVSAEETKLQRIKKCEYILVRKLRSGPQD